MKQVFRLTGYATGVAPDEATADPGGSDGEDFVRLTDSRAIRALAHPARLAVLDALNADGRTLTATEAAEVTGLSPSAMSYHLRALAKWGIVRPVEADPTGDGRERRWKRGGRGLMMESLDPGAESATAMIAARYLDVTRDKALEFLQHSSRETKFWQENATISHAETWMTEEEARELNVMSHQLVERFRSAGRDGRPPNTRRVRTTFVMVPIDEPPGAQASAETGTAES